MSALAALGRTLADSADRESWLALHDTTIGASTAAKFAKPASVETYIRQILTPRTFTGSTATESGNRWEPMLLAWTGFEANSLYIHHPDERGFASTPDGVREVDGRLRLAEIKAKHNKVVAGPVPAEVRQMAWQLHTIPEAESVDFTWGELVHDENGEWVLRRDPQTLVYHRDHPAIVAATALIVPIAHQVLAGVRAARAIELEHAS